MTTAKVRGTNWSPSETMALRESYLTHRDVLESKFSATVRHEHKDAAWRSIVDSVNAQSKTVRTIEMVKKKISDLKTSLKKRERERRRLAGMTGGGPAPQLLEWEERMLEAIGEEAVCGFGGVDTFGINDEKTLELKTPCSQLDNSFVPPPSVKPLYSESSCSSSKQYTETSKKTRKSSCTKDVDGKNTVLELLKKQNELLLQMIEEQKKTNKILGELFAVNIEQ